MKEITLSFTPEELLELARQLHLASYFRDDDTKENQQLADAIQVKVCATGFTEANEHGDYEHGDYMELPFTISSKVCETCDHLIDIFEDDAIMEYLPYALADRDFIDKHGVMEPQNVLNDPLLLGEVLDLQELYKMEILLNGVDNLRLVNKDSPKA